MYAKRNIIIFEDYGRYYADYKSENGKRFGLHRASCGTAKEAYNLAVKEIDYLNGKENGK